MFFKKSSKETDSRYTSGEEGRSVKYSFLNYLKDGLILSIISPFIIEPIKYLLENQRKRKKILSTNENYHIRGSISLVSCNNHIILSHK